MLWRWNLARACRRMLLRRGEPIGCRCFEALLLSLTEIAWKVQNSSSASLGYPGNRSYAQLLVQGTLLCNLMLNRMMRMSHKIKAFSLRNEACMPRFAVMAHLDLDFGIQSEDL